MKRLIILLCVLALSLPAFGALTKSTALDELNAWEALAATVMDKTDPCDISGSYATVVGVDVALTVAGAQDGVKITIEVSSAAADDWIPYQEVTVLAGVTPTIGDINDTPLTTETSVTLTDSTAGKYDQVGQVWFIVDTTVAQSEIVRTLTDNTADDVEIAQDLKYTHEDTEVTTDEVYQGKFAIPMCYAYVRVLVHNTDAASGCHWRATIAKVTAL